MTAEHQITIRVGGSTSSFSITEGARRAGMSCEEFLVTHGQLVEAGWLVPLPDGSFEVTVPEVAAS